MTCFSLSMNWSFVLFMLNATIQRFWQVIMFYDGINNLKEILFWIEEFDLRLFTWGLPSRRFRQRWSSSLPLCPHPPHPDHRAGWDYWHRYLVSGEQDWQLSCIWTVWQNLEIKGWIRLDGGENSPAQGELHSSPSPRRPSSRCCSPCSPPSQRCSRQNLSS